MERCGRYACVKYKLSYSGFGGRESLILYLSRMIFPEELLYGVGGNGIWGTGSEQCDMTGYRFNDKLHGYSNIPD